MLTRNPGLMLVLLFAVAAHASLTDRWLTDVQHGKQLGFAILLAPILLILLGEWITQDAAALVWQQRGCRITLLGALWHLILDGASLALLGTGLPSVALVAAGALAGALLAAWVAQQALRRLRKAGTEDSDADPSQAPPPRGWLARIAREASLFGSTAAMVCLVGLGMVAMAAVGLWRHPEAWPKLLGAAAFFALCGLVGVWMGLDRRAMLLRQPSPFARFRPRFLRRSRAIPTQEGLALIGRRGATIYVWESITAVSLGEYQGSPALFLNFGPAAVPQRLLPDGSPAQDDPTWLRRQRRNQELMRLLAGCDLVIMSVLTEQGPGVLAEQISRLLCDYEGRAQLPTCAAALRELGAAGTRRDPRS